MKRFIVAVLLCLAVDLLAAGVPAVEQEVEQPAASFPYGSKAPGFIHRSLTDGMEHRYNSRYASKCVGEITRGYSVLHPGVPPAFVDTVMLVVQNCENRRVALKLYGPVDQGKYVIKLARKCKGEPCLRPEFSATLGEVSINGTNKMIHVQPVFNFDDLDLKYDYQFVLQRGNNNAYKGDYIWAF